MSKHTFGIWLNIEVTASRCALLKLYAEQERLLHIEGPQLEKDYMEKIGPLEETVIKEEIECELMAKKQAMIQAAINRREPIDEAAIDAQIDQERQKLLSAAQGDSAPVEFAQLTAEQADELQEIYREVVKNYHPQMHPELTNVHRELYQKAQEAYRRRDLQALKLVFDMLQSTAWEGIELELSLQLVMGEGEDTGASIEKHEYDTDYALAASLYHSFIPTAEEIAIREEWDRCKRDIESVMANMTATRERFPYNAAAMLADPAQIEAYKEELRQRHHAAKQETEQLKVAIEKMKERTMPRGEANASCTHVISGADVFEG